MLYYYYTITNKVNQKKYCGITIDFKNRIAKHKRELEANCHHSIKLQNAYNKHGKDNFIFKVEFTKEFDNNTEAYQEEVKFISSHDSYYNGYNMTFGGLGSLSPESFEKTKLSWQQRVPNIYQIDPNTYQVISIFPSLREIERVLHLSHANVAKVCKREDISAGGYYWCYEQDWFDNWIPPLNKKYRPIGLFNEEGELIRVFQSCADAGRKLNLKRENIRDAILRDGKCHGFKFNFITLELYELYACRD